MSNSNILNPCNGTCTLLPFESYKCLFHKYNKNDIIHRMYPKFAMTPTGDLSERSTPTNLDGVTLSGGKRRMLYTRIGENRN